MSKTSNDTEEIVRIAEIYTERFGKEAGRGSRGIFGIEDKAEVEARTVKLEAIKREIEKHERGYEGAIRQCPQCGGETQTYKGNCSRRLQFDCGELEIRRAYYVCSNCRTSSYPLDEKLGLVNGQEQGHLREKMSMLGIIAPYHKAPEVCSVLLGHEQHSASLRRLIIREANHFENSNIDEQHTLEVSIKDTVYLQIDGHLCPTREKRRDENDKGFREAKVMMAFKMEDITKVSKDRNEVLNKILKGKITASDEFILTAQDVYQQANAADAGRVAALADGAQWIWNTFDEIAPEAIQILDFAHAKSYLYQAAKIIFGSNSDLVKPWVKQQEDLLFEDKADEVILNIEKHSKSHSEISGIVTYFTNNQSRMNYGTYQAQGLHIASGAIESAGKRIAQGRVKGGGMRWNVIDLNKLLSLRCAFLDNSLEIYWNQQRKLAA